MNVEAVARQILARLGREIGHEPMRAGELLGMRPQQRDSVRRRQCRAVTEIDLELPGPVLRVARCDPGAPELEIPDGAEDRLVRCAGRDSVILDVRIYGISA